jgi:hypothetical protein
MYPYGQMNNHIVKNHIYENQTLLFLNLARAAFQSTRSFPIQPLKNPTHLTLHLTDELTRRGSINYFVGPEPFVKLSQGTIITAFKAYAKTKHHHEWRNEAGFMQSKLFIEGVDSGLTKNSGNPAESNSELYLGCSQVTSGSRISWSRWDYRIVYTVECVARRMILWNTYCMNVTMMITAIRNQRISRYFR